jgi:hypothetical protein
MPASVSVSPIHSAIPNVPARFVPYTTSARTAVTSLSRPAAVFLAAEPVLVIAYEAWGGTLDLACMQQL